MRKAFIFLLTLLISASMIGCELTEAQKSPAEKAKDFEIQDINGNIVKLSDYPGKVILLNFFATWCPPCRMEMPDFNLIEKEYKDKVKIIAINAAHEPLPAVQEFVKTNNLEFTVAIDDGRVGALYGPIPGIPVTVIIDKDFNIARKYVGLRPKEVFVNDINELLKGGV
jgi:thiol-disulfide isomerase/thioredoxin